MDYSKKHEISVYLTEEQLNQRIAEIGAQITERFKGRGVVLRDGQTLYDLYLERTPLYEKYADIRISETGLDIEQTVEQIVDGITNLHESSRIEIMRSDYTSRVAYYTK